MAIKKISLKNFTVFDQLDLDLSEGINVFVGENGMGKTHIMKVLYSACQAVSPKVSFSNKLVRCFGTDDHRILRLVRSKQGNLDAAIRVTSQIAGQSASKVLTAKFSKKTSKWDATVGGEDGWEKQLQNLSSIFIPAKEILSNAYNLSAAVEKNNVSFDDTYIDVVNSAKVNISMGKNAATKQNMLKKIESIIDGKVTFNEKRDEFYLKQGNSYLEFNLVAEGVRKIALLWLLTKNGMLNSGSVLFWDEPEANINPIHIPVIVDILLELQRSGVQVFIATHDYFLTQYLEVKRVNADKIRFHSFFKGESAVEAESNDSFKTLEHNPILETFIQLYREEVEKAVKG